MRLITTGAVLAALVLAACGGDPTDPVERADCAVVVDRWVEIQQDLLMTLDELDAATPEANRNAILQRTAAATFENARDAQTIGCESAIEAGSAETCARLAELQPNSTDAQDVVAGLEAGCEAAA